jgi:hypothetical protein
MRKLFCIFLLGCSLCAAVPPLFATPEGDKKTEEKKDTTAAMKSPYQKLLGSGTQTVNGMLTIHVRKGKTYFEIPDCLYGRR